jgi:cation diffusion facilitator family transporter
MTHSSETGAAIASAIRWGWLSIAVGLTLVVLLGLIAAYSGSLAVIAELIHNVVDLVAAIAVVIGLKIAARKSDAFPYGLYKVENLVAAAIGCMIFFTAYEVVRTAFFGESGELHTDGWMLAALAVTLAIPLIFSHFELRAAIAADSPALIAQAREFRIHAYTTGLAFVALLSWRFGIPLDRAAALVIVAAIVKTGWDLFADAVRVLLDASLDAERVNEIKQIILADPAVAEVGWVTARNAGRFRFAEAGVALKGGELGKAEAALERIGKTVRTAIPQVERVLLHLEARKSAQTTYAIPLASLSGAISEHFGEAAYFAFVSVGQAAGAVIEQRILPNPHLSLDKGKGMQVAQWLATRKVDVVLAKVELSGRGPDYVFRDAGIKVQRTEENTLSEAIHNCVPAPAGAR